MYTMYNLKIFVYTEIDWRKQKSLVKYHGTTGQKLYHWVGEFVFEVYHAMLHCYDMVSPCSASILCFKNILYLQTATTIVSTFFSASRCKIKSNPVKGNRMLWDQKPVTILKNLGHPRTFEN